MRAPSRLLSLVGVLGLSLALAACASAPQASGASQSPSPAASADAAPSPSPTPTAEPEPDAIVVSSAGIALERADETEWATYDDPDAVVQLVTGATGSAPEYTHEEHWGAETGYDFGPRDLYEWAGFSVSVNGERASVAVDAAATGGIGIRTDAGVAVGSDREVVVAAGAWDEWDSDGDGAADYLGLDPLEVPGTTSLTRPDAVGILYVLLVMDGDVVRQIQAPGNDFSDL
ncbi:hypothetical protein [Microbacterium thalassium]|uniref:Uncharacterized protein n=1 Tax=Microbacterium thalassium TaxID=362649 RepID=A0A7X0KVL2_9MICO|nr:hypothetical protein [Microbacterium thalassium]MBB6392357.1 hypothetical protein [Microbacterium thalassium]GLK23568.1 hypothetical protein GCM10017607_08860 [Microbacterium thalassium]